MKRFIGAVILACAWLSGPSANADQPLTDGKGAPLVHLNVAAAGWGGSVVPGKENTNYVFPSTTYLNKWQKAGIRVIRFSILWERLQPKQLDKFDSVYAKRIDTFLAQAAERNMGVIIDIHNYGRYYDQIIGTNAVPTSSYKNLMKRVAQRWANNPGVHGYDLMNEPYGDANDHWKVNAQAGIDGIRMYDKVHPIYVEGRSWSNTSMFPDLNGDLLLLKDPIDNLVFSSHLYLDEGSSGAYSNPISGAFDPMIGVNRAKPFVEWLIRNKKRGQLGEFGVPDNDPRWLKAMDNLLSYLNQKCVPLAYWAAGPWWGNDPLAIEPINGIMRPQWPVLSKWIKAGNNCP
jgi:endoglucanase